MKSFHTFLTEAVLKTDIEQLRKDAGAWTKNIRRISSVHELVIVGNAFRRWQKHAYQVIYGKIIGVSDGAFDETGESWESKHLRSAAWELLSGDNLIVPYVREYRGVQTRNSAGEYALTDANRVWWDDVYREFERKRNSIYTKVGRLIREMFEALDTFFGQSTSTPDHAQQTTVSVEGIPVTITTSEKKNSEDRPQTALRIIRDAILRLKSLGWAGYLRKLQINVFTNAYDSSAAGTYNGGGSITIFAAGINSHTVIHEIGHHVFKHLSRERQLAWERFVKDNRISFTDDDLAQIHQVYRQAFDREKTTARGYTIHDFWQKLVNYIPDRNVKAKMKHFLTLFGKSARRKIVFDPFVDGSDLDEKWNMFVHETRGSFLLFAPTDYSNKNPEEAFCEVFASYGLRDPLADIVTAVFEDVMNLR